MTRQRDLFVIRARGVLHAPPRLENLDTIRIVCLHDWANFGAQLHPFPFWGHLHIACSNLAECGFDIADVDRLLDSDRSDYLQDRVRL